MVFRMFATALVAGLLAAVLITGLQALITTPMILQAESYEITDPTHDHGAHDHGDHEHGPADWSPAEGTERMLYTLLANVGAGVGFALLLVVGLSFEKASVGTGRGILWGIAGFAVFTLAPNLGLPPELPGMPAGDLTARQIWWLATILLSAAGLGATVFGKASIIKVLGLVLLVLPHVWGAPHGVGDSEVPAELAARFTAATIVLSAVFWVMIGYFSSLIFARMGRNSAEA